MSEILEKDVFKNPISFMRPALASGLNKNSSVKEAIDLMVEKKIGSILIFDDAENLAGILTERDFLIRLKMEKTNLSEIRLEEVMTKSPSFLNLNSSIEEALAQMVTKEFRHVPIGPEGSKDIPKSPMHIISARDILKFIVNHFPLSVAALGTTTADTILIQDAHDEAFNRELQDSKGKFLTGAIFSLPLSKIIARSQVMVAPEDSLDLVHKKMIDGRAEAAIVVEYATKVLGIITERDFMVKVISKNQWGKDIPVKNLMTPHPHALMPSHQLAYAINNMFKYGYRHVILVDEEKCPIGLISVLEILGFIYRRIFSTVARSEV